MNLAKNTAKSAANYMKNFIKWVLVASVVGIIGGAVGSVFHLLLDMVGEIRGHHGWIVYFLPIAGVAIAGLYALCRKKGKLDTNRVIESVQTEEKVPLILSPLIVVSTLITQLFGGSAGREGAALQLGGSIGYNIGRCFKLNKPDMHVIVMAGMSAVFTALFGTPLTAAVFAMEVATVGYFHYGGFLACIISSAVAFMISSVMGATPVRFSVALPDVLSAEMLIKVVILSFLCAIVSMMFCIAIKKSEHYMKKLFANVYLRAFVGGGVVVILTLLLGTRDYNGAGMEIVARAMQGDARAEAFILKIIFTAITIAAGFKGGEIVPTLFIGSTFGCVVGGLLGLDPAFGAAIGFVALFCGVVNCPLASIVLAVEVFGGKGIMPFAIACGVSFMMSGYFGLYKSQKIEYSKFTDEIIDINAK
ncbi:MAG: chloride channel protein [Clostridia bacterium]|nr:chloride channel protein [Clostridia bacterium]